MKKIVFLGGKQIGYKCLQCLCKEKEIEIVLAISNMSDLYDSEDRWYPKIHELAGQHSIPYMATDDINSDKMVAKIHSISPDFMFVVYYDNILSQKIFSQAKEGTINLHLADAEKYRGCYPTTYAIINGETEYGVTLHYIDEGVDSGDIIDKEVFELQKEWTGKDLYRAATEKGYELFKRNIKNIISGNLKRRVQKSPAHISYYKRSQFPSHEITFEGKAGETLNRIRALLFSPFPPPYFYLGDKKFIIVEARESSEKEGQ